MTISQENKAKIDKLILWYKKLKLEDQKKELIKICKKHINLHPVFQWLLTTIETNSSINSIFLEHVYEETLILGAKWLENEKEKSLHKINALQEYMRDLRLREEKEKAQENPDLLLENL